MSRRITILVAVWLTLGTAAYAASPEEAANSVAGEIMSPFCPGVTLHECPSREALRLRDRIESWFQDGLTRDEVMARLESEYGPQIRAVPTSDGVGLLGWLLPIGGVLAAIGLGIWLTAKWSRSRPPETVSTMEEADRLRIEEELAAVRSRP